MSYQDWKLVNERTGEFMQLKNECLVLERAGCDGTYTNSLNYLRASATYLCEVWLETVSAKAGSHLENRLECPCLVAGGLKIQSHIQLQSRNVIAKMVFCKCNN